MSRKHWVVDLTLIIIILVMGVFVYIELSRTFDFMRNRPGSQQGDELTEPDLVLDQSTVTPDDGVVNIFKGDDEGLKLLDLAGDPVTLSDFKGKAVLVNFWATWCPPCLDEMPLIDDYADRFKEELVVLAINAGENEPVVRNFAAEYDFSFNILLDPTNSAAKRYHVYGYPTTMFFDEEGDIQSTHIGELNEKLLINYLLKIGIGE